MERLIFRLCCQNQFNSVVVGGIGRASRIFRSLVPSVELAGLRAIHGFVAVANFSMAAGNF